MKRTLLLICTLLCANVLMAQEQLATLKHNDSISVYYGANAFEQAYNAAANGDIITLSDGVFSTPGILQKGITVRGNGAVVDTARRSTGTYFMNDFGISIGNVNTEINIEGIYIKEITFNPNDRVLTLNLTKCIIDTIDRGLQELEGRTIINAYNCIFRNGCVHGSSVNYIDNIHNCILHERNHYFPHYANCYNSIVIGKGDSENTIGSAIYNNCILINMDSTDTIIDHFCNNNILINCTTDSNEFAFGNVVMSLSDVFENWDGETLSTDLETYVLKSSVSNSILGLDGSEVGIFGGVIPFDWTPTYSVIKRLDVPNTPDENGMLNIDVEFLTE